MTNLEIRKYLARIISSESFARSEVYKRLLTYLTESTLNGERPKEFTIGLDVFNQKADDPASSNVRVYVHKLRKKLETYYSKEGYHDHIYFSIPKGAYSIVFKARKKVLKVKSIKNIWIIVLVSLLFAASNLTYILIQRSDYQRLKKTAFWDELISNELETVIVAGDFFVFYDEKLNQYDGRFRNIRDIHINNEDQLREYVDSNDSLDLIDFLIPKNTTYMPRDALLCMQYLGPLLERNNVSYQIILSTNFTWEAYNQYNIIYLGSFKNLKSLTLLTDHLAVKYNHMNDSLSFKGQKGTSYFSSYFRKQDNIDFALTAKIPGPQKNVIYCFASSHDIGSIESVKYFTTLDSVRGFEKRLLKDANYFKAIYKAEGIARTGIAFDLVEYEPITDTLLSNFWYQ